jgi:hypothetical protein
MQRPWLHPWCLLLIINSCFPAQNLLCILTLWIANIDLNWSILFSSLELRIPIISSLLLRELIQDIKHFPTGRLLFSISWCYILCFIMLTVLHCISSRFKKRRRLGTTAAKISNVHPHIMDLDSASPKEAQAGSENDFVPREDDGTLLSYDSLSFFFLS